MWTRGRWTELTSPSPRPALRRCSGGGVRGGRAALDAMGPLPLTGLWWSLLRVRWRVRGAQVNARSTCTWSQQTRSARPAKDKVVWLGSPQPQPWTSPVGLYLILRYLVTSLCSMSCFTPSAILYVSIYLYMLMTSRTNEFTNIHCRSGKSGVHSQYTSCWFA